MAEGIQKRLQTELEKYKAVQKDYQKCVMARQQLDSQLNENKIVLEELKRLEAEASVFKLIGPVLVKQDQEEAKQNVQKRIDYISAELKRHDGLIKDIEKKQEAHRETLGKLQTQYQQQQVKAAVKA
jgi:prefoldin beta subunit